jgi:DnaJ-class molecular chaperone
MAVVDFKGSRRRPFYERRIARFEMKDKCPDCRGRGRTRGYVNEFYYEEPGECQGCSGSGKYTEWKNNQRRKTM